MKAAGHRSKEWLAVTGYVLLALLALPAAAVVVFVLRGAVLVTLVAGLGAGVALWLTSARFRAWCEGLAEPEAIYKGLRLATDVAVHSGHAWARVDGKDVTIGVDELVPAVLGPVEAVELPSAGWRVACGDTLFRLRRGGRVVELPAPVSGTVLAGNSALEREPGLVNEDPFRRGWAVRLRGTLALDRERRCLRRGPDARTWFRGEVDRLLATVLGEGGVAPALADGGALAGDLYRRIDDGSWSRVTEALRGAPGWTEPAPRDGC
jgi:glycine cleavage system H protein